MCNEERDAEKQWHIVDMTSLPCGGSNPERIRFAKRQDEPLLIIKCQPQKLPYLIAA